MVEKTFAGFGSSGTVEEDGAEEDVFEREDVEEEEEEAEEVEEVSFPHETSARRLKTRGRTAFFLFMLFS